MLLRFKFEKVKCIDNPNRLVTLLKNERFDVIILDMNFSAGVNSGNEGLYWLKEIIKIDPTISVVTITAYGDVNLAVKSLKLGAADFVLKPWDNKNLITTIEASLKLKKSRDKMSPSAISTKKASPKESGKQSEIVGNSPPFKEVLDVVHKVAGTDVNILITGENGTGKELIAREIHQRSDRHKEKLVSVDLGAMNSNLFESELFGHTKGSFTDAINDRRGKFDEANHGSLFLDEIGNTPLVSQVKLLAAIQNRVITPVGSNEAIPVDIRLICATNANLEELVRSGDFREDLLYRINTIEIKLPPLRERSEDILLLTDHFLILYTEKYEKKGLSLSMEAKRQFEDYNWPGNIRELQHMIEKAVILSDGKELTENDFDFKSNIQQRRRSNPQTLEQMERIMIIEVVKKYEGNMSSAASELGVSRQTLYNKIKRFDLEGELLSHD
ncbi:MAG: sigma-54-dependent Fis family transcriptional regulator [Reichenbachiella sp.]